MPKAKKPIKEKKPKVSTGDAAKQNLTKLTAELKRLGHSTPFVVFSRDGMIHGNCSKTELLAILTNIAIHEPAYRAAFKIASNFDIGKLMSNSFGIELEDLKAVLKS